MSVCVSKNQGVGLGSPLPVSVSPRSGGLPFLWRCRLALRSRLSFPCGFWSSLCPCLLLFLLFPLLVLLLLWRLLLLVLPCWLPCLVLVGLLLLWSWLFACLVLTPSPWFALTVVFVSVVLPTLLVPWVVLSLRTWSSLVSLLVWVRLFASVLRSGTLLTLGLSVLRLLEGFLGWLLVGGFPRASCSVFLSGGVLCFTISSPVAVSLV